MLIDLAPVTLALGSSSKYSGVTQSGAVGREISDIVCFSLLPFGCSCITMMCPPPIPVCWELTTPRQIIVAIAASTAEPWWRAKMSVPTAEQRLLSDEMAAKRYLPDDERWFSSRCSDERREKIVMFVNCNKWIDVWWCQCENVNR